MMAARRQSPKMICRPGVILFRGTGGMMADKNVMMNHLNGCLPDGRDTE
jgi:hypothetical protein